jgi:hypothetical protein
LEIAGLNRADLEYSMWANVGAVGFTFAAGAVDHGRPCRFRRGALLSGALGVSRSAACFFENFAGVGHANAA